MTRSGEVVSRWILVLLTQMAFVIAFRQRIFTEYAQQRSRPLRISDWQQPAKVQLAEPPAFSGAHAAARAGRAIVVALQVENAMDDVEGEFPAGRGAELAGLRDSARDGNDQLPVTGAVVET